MAGLAFKTKQIITSRSRGFQFSVGPGGSLSVGLLQQVTLLPPWTEVIPTELDFAWGPAADISADQAFQIFLSVVDIDNLPELASLQENAVWSDAQIWRVSTGSFTIPTQTLSKADPRFFHPKSYKAIPVGQSARRQALAFIGVSTITDINFFGVGVLRWTEIITQRMFGSDNAFDDVHEEDGSFEDDYGMDIDE